VAIRSHILKLHNKKIDLGLKRSGVGILLLRKRKKRKERNGKGKGKEKGGKGNPQFTFLAIRHWAPGRFHGSTAYLSADIIRVRL